MDAKSWIQEIRAAGKLMAAGDLAGAEGRYRQLLDKGTDNPLHKALALDGLGRAVFEQGRQAEAIEAIEEAVSLLRERQGVQDPATCGALQNLGRLYLAAGQVEKSIAVSREAVDGLRAGFGEDHPLVAGAMMRLSACLYMQRDLDGAEALLLKARDVFEKQSGDESRMDVSTCLTIWDASTKSAVIWNRASPCTARLWPSARNCWAIIRKRPSRWATSAWLWQRPVSGRKPWILCRKPWTAMPVPGIPPDRISKATARILRSAATP